MQWNLDIDNVGAGSGIQIVDSSSGSDASGALD